jgi:hypothetical protein
MKSICLKLIAAAGLVFAVPAGAQVAEIDPNDAGAYATSPDSPVPQQSEPEYQPIEQQPGAQAPAAVVTAPGAPATSAAPLTRPEETVAKNEVLAAAENVFGKGAEGLAGIVEKILKEQGEPSAYIAGQEAGGALGVGLRYGSGTMRHQGTGDQPVYWTGPTIGFDAGADANKVFVLVYNLTDAQKLFRRYPSAEGHAYAIGGFTASMLRRGDIVLIPVRLGVGFRLGANVGYMSFSEKQRWLPF